VVPADLSWETGGQPAVPGPEVTRPPVAAQVLDEVAALLESGDPPVLFLGGRALTERGLLAASRIGAATGARLLAETFPARIEGGAGLPRVQRLAYFPDQADKQMAGIRQLILIGARSPVAFFGYPGRGGDLVPDGCVVTTLADRSQDAEAALEELAARVAAGTGPVVAGPVVAGPVVAGPAVAEPAVAEPAVAEPGATEPVVAEGAGSGAGQPEIADEPLTAFNLAGVLAASLPDQAIVVDEGNTSSLGLPTALAGAARHSLLCLTGGAIGMGLPVATGAAVAAPDRPVVALEADGSALYTIQALWTQAREQLNVTTVLINNAAYAVLRVELARTGAGQAGPRAGRLLDLSDPVTDFTAVSTGLGVPATRVTTTAGLDQALRRAYAEPGPHLIEAIVPPVA
jgi:acetolactate synthase I/II/III large subunit